MAGKACFTSKIHRSLHLCKTSRNNPASRLFVLLQIFATTTSVDKFVDARFAHKLWESPAALSTCGEIASVHGLFTGLIHRSAKGGRIRTDPAPRVASFYPQGYAAVCRFAINCRVAMAQDVKRPAHSAAPAPCRKGHERHEDRHRQVQATTHHRLRDAETGGVIMIAGQQEQHGAGRQQFAKAKLKRSPIF